MARLGAVLQTIDDRVAQFRNAILEDLRNLSMVLAEEDMKSRRLAKERTCVLQAVYETDGNYFPDALADQLPHIVGSANGVRLFVARAMMKDIANGNLDYEDKWYWNTTEVQGGGVKVDLSACCPGGKMGPVAMAKLAKLYALRGVWMELGAAKLMVDELQLNLNGQLNDTVNGINTGVHVHVNKGQAVRMGTLRLFSPDPQDGERHWKVMSPFATYLLAGGLTPLGLDSKQKPKRTIDWVKTLTTRGDKRREQLSKRGTRKALEAFGTRQ